MIQRPRVSHVAALALALALGACGSKDDGKAAKAAGGEVLPGTVSDAMIDLDRTQAEAPLQAVQPSTGAKAAAKDDAAPAAEASGPAAESETAAPATAPSPTASATASSKPAPSPKPSPSASPKPKP